jgi:hypothetical protein
MIDFIRLATYQTVSLNMGHAMELTAKLAGNRIVFAGGHLSSTGIEADADIRAINACWKLYCVAHDAKALGGVPLIYRSAIDAALGK